jgi:hypothetical protein
MAHRGELVIFASSLHPGPWSEALPLGAVVGRRWRTDGRPLGLSRMTHHRWRLLFEQPETFPKPIPCTGYPSFFYLPAEVSRQLPRAISFPGKSGRCANRLCGFEQFKALGQFWY